MASVCSALMGDHRQTQELVALPCLSATPLLIRSQESPEHLLSKIAVNDSLIALLDEKQMRSCLRHLFCATDGNEYSLMFWGTTPPIVSGAFEGAFCRAISFTFSFMM
jgi:hypothetical protein